MQINLPTLLRIKLIIGKDKFASDYRCQWKEVISNKSIFLIRVQGNTKLLGFYPFNVKVLPFIRLSFCRAEFRKLHINFICPLIQEFSTHKEYKLPALR